MIRFDAKALYAAMNVKRETQGLTWTQVAKACGVAATTIRRTAQGGRLEVDGMLAMVNWLGRPVEDFVRRTNR